MQLTQRRHLELRRLAAEHAGVWCAHGPDVVCETGERVVYCGTPALAAYVAGLHNSWLLLSNALILANRKRADQRMLAAVTAKEQA